MPPPAISVVVSNLNGERWLPRLFASLDAQEGVEIDLIVVDRESTDGSAELLAARSDLRIVTEPPETGLVAGYHAGAQHANAPLLFFCNEDLYLGPDCLRLLAERVDVSAGVVAADPWQWTYDGQDWIHGGVRFCPARLEFNSVVPWRKQDPVVPLTAGEAVAFGCAGAMLIDAGTYEAIGGWDTSFFLDYEDVDLFMRVWQRGLTCVTVPDAKVFHAVGASNAQQLGRRRQPVSRRRYVSGRANISVVALKYFSWRWAGVALLTWLMTLGKDTVLVRPRRVWLDLLVARELVGRLPAVVGYRRAHRALNRSRPGERFFVEPRFAREAA